MSTYLILVSSFTESVPWMWWSVQEKQVCISAHHEKKQLHYVANNINGRLQELDPVLGSNHDASPLRSTALVKHESKQVTLNPTPNYRNPI